MNRKTDTKEVKEVVSELRSAFELSFEERLALYEKVLELVREKEVK